MTELQPLIAPLALLLSLLALVGLGVYALQLRRQSRQSQQRLDTMQSDLRALCNAAVQVGERANRLEQAMKQLQQRQQELGVRQDKLVQSEPEGRTYEQAVKLAQKGTPLEELMEICSLSRGEAELIIMMNRLDRGQ